MKYLVCLRIAQVADELQLVQSEVVSAVAQQVEAGVIIVSDGDMATVGSPVSKTCKVIDPKLHNSRYCCYNRITLGVADLDSYRVYHFHDTSETAVMKGFADIEDNRVLRPRAENLAAFLYFLQVKHSDYFSLIEDTVRQLAK